MAYIKDLKTKCAHCDKPATKELIDKWNGSRGKFCGQCAKLRLKQLLAYEKQTDPL